MSGLTRLYATVGQPRDYPKVRHVVGVPPEAAGEGNDTRRRLPWPRVVVIEETDEAGFTLLRLDAKGDFAGDTWHPDLDQAQEQAEYEFGAALSQWRGIPEDISDATRYALSESQREVR